MQQRTFSVSLTEEQLCLLRYGLAMAKAQAEKSIKAIPDVMCQQANKQAIDKILSLDRLLTGSAAEQLTRKAG